MNIKLARFGSEYTDGLTCTRLRISSRFSEHNTSQVCGCTVAYFAVRSRVRRRVVRAARHNVCQKCRLQSGIDRAQLSNCYDIAAAAMMVVTVAAVFTVLIGVKHTTNNSVAALAAAAVASLPNEYCTYN